MISSHRIRLNRFGGQIINNKNRKWMAAFALSNSHERVHHLWQLSHMDSMAIGDFCARTNNNKNNKHCADLSSTASSYDRYVRLQSSIYKIRAKDAREMLVWKHLRALLQQIKAEWEKDIKRDILKQRDRDGDINFKTNRRSQIPFMKFFHVYTSWKGIIKVRKSSRQIRNGIVNSFQDEKLSQVMCMFWKESRWKWERKIKRNPRDAKCFWTANTRGGNWQSKITSLFFIIKERKKGQKNKYMLSI